MRQLLSCLWAAVLGVLICGLGGPVGAAYAQAQASRSTAGDEPRAQDARSALDAATRAAQSLSNQQTYLLEYKWDDGDEFRWAVEHVVTTRTQIRGQTETSASRSRSTKLWRVVEVDPAGQARVELVVEDVSMWTKLSAQEPVVYDSRKSDTPPAGYENVAESIGVPLMTITLDRQGRVVDRKSNIRQISLGVGDTTMPLPNGPIAIGQRWTVAGELTAREADGRLVPIKTRTLYRLDSVADGKARIEFRTEVLTPIDSPKVQSQILQHMTRGWIGFDIAAGRIVTKEAEWDETVQGFEGADSLLAYLGRFHQRWVPPRDGAAVTADGGPLRLKLRGDPPVLRY